MHLKISIQCCDNYILCCDNYIKMNLSSTGVERVRQNY